MSYGRGFGGAGDRGNIVREIKPVCEPGPEFEACRAEKLTETALLLAVLAAFLTIAGTWIWLVLSGRWELLRITHLNKAKLRQLLRR